MRESGSAGMSWVCIHEDEIVIPNFLQCVRMVLRILHMDGELERSFLSAVRTEEGGVRTEVVLGGNREVGVEVAVGVREEVVVEVVEGE